MLKSKYLTGLILVTTLMATLIPFSAMVYAQNQEKEKVEAFLALAEQSKEQVESLMELVEEQEGIEFPQEARTLYDTGSGLLEQAWTAFNGEDYEGAIELAREALKNFREAVKVLNKALEPIEEIEAESEHSALGEAITRARDRRNRVVGIIDAMLVSYPDLDTTGILSDIRDTLEVDAEAHLASAEAYLDAGDVAGAAKELGWAHRLISSALVSLKKQVAGALNSGRVKGFLTVIKKFHERLSKLVERTVEEPLKTTLKAELAAAKLYIDAAELPTATFSEQMSNLMMARSLLESVQRAIVESRKGGSKGGVYCVFSLLLSFLYFFSSIWF